MFPTLILSEFLRFLIPLSVISSDVSSFCEVFHNSRNTKKMLNSLECPGRTWFHKLDVFFCIFHHHLRHFPPCSRLNRMTQCTIIPGSSITASNIPKQEGKAHTGLFFFLEHPLLTSLWLPMSLLFTLSSVSLTDSFTRYCICISVTSPLDSSPSYSPKLSSFSTSGI